MEPYIKMGDYVLVKKQENYEVGEVITFKVTDGYVTNRIISVDEENDAIITKGDANDERDISAIKKESISGIVFFRFRILGYVYYILYKWETWVVIAVIYLLAGKIDFKGKKKKKKKEDEPEEKEEEKEDADDFIELLKYFLLFLGI